MSHCLWRISGSAQGGRRAGCPQSAPGPGGSPHCGHTEVPPPAPGPGKPLWRAVHPQLPWLPCAKQTWEVGQRHWADGALTSVTGQQPRNSDDHSLLSGGPPARQVGNVGA